MDNDATTWQALNALVLTVIGLVISGLLWRSRGPASGIRGVAWSLLPVAAYLTGTLKLVWQIGDATLDWALRFVFSPLVWLGLTVLVVSVALFVLSSVMRRRGIGTTERGDQKQGTGRGVEAAPDRDRSPAPTDTTEDMDDIEAILKKHGIS